MNPIKRILTIFLTLVIILPSAVMFISANEDPLPEDVPSAETQETPEQDGDVNIPCTHEWSEWEYSNDPETGDAMLPSCTVEGKLQRICSLCDETEYMYEDILPHSYSDPVNLGATCTEPEKEISTCTVCEYEQITELSPALGHKWGSWSENDHDCTEAGERTRTCHTCGATETETTAPGEHGWGPWNEYTIPDCTAEGSDKRVCMDCDAVEFRTVAPLGHTWGEWDIITDTTCTEPGEHTHTCIKCGTFENGVIDPKGHSFGEWTTVTEATYLSDGEMIRTCTACGIRENKPIEKLANPFTDVKVNKWYTTPILFCLQNEYMVGTTEALFSLSQPVTRAMTVQIMAKIAGADLNTAEFQKSSFSDVSTGKWYTSAVEWAYKNGLAAGTGGDCFSYKKNVTREEMALFLMKLAKFMGADTSAKGALPGVYKDISRIHSWAYDAVDWAITSGVMHGSTSKYISPRIDLTRAQIAEIIHDFADKLALKN